MFSFFVPMMRLAEYLNLFVGQESINPVFCLSYHSRLQTLLDENNYDYVSFGVSEIKTPRRARKNLIDDTWIGCSADFFCSDC